MAKKVTKKRRKSKKEAEAIPAFQKILAAMDEINNDSKQQTIFSLSSKDSFPKIERINTGLEALNECTGGGLPRGRIVELYGDESSGKTSLAYHLCAQCESSLYIPIEGTFDPDMAERFGNNSGNMLVSWCDYGDDAIKEAAKFIKAGIDLIVIDSIPSLIPSSMYLKKNQGNEDNRFSPVAQLLSKELPYLITYLKRSRTTLLFINQARAKIGATMFQEQIDTMGGRALRHANSLKIKLARRAWIEVPNKNAINPAKKEKVGMISKLKVMKSKVCKPYMEAELPFFFDRGFVSFDDINTIRQELMIENRKNLKLEREA